MSIGCRLDSFGRRLDTPQALGWNEPTVVGFNDDNAPGHKAQDESACPIVFHPPTYCGSGLRLSDDDLADDLGALNLSKDGPGPSSSSAHGPLASHHLRTHVSEPALTSYIPLLTHQSQHPQWYITFTSRQRCGSPSDSGLSAGATPPCSQHYHSSYGLCWCVERRR